MRTVRRARREREINRQYEFFLIHRLSQYIFQLTDEYTQGHHMSPTTYVYQLTDEHTQPIFIDCGYIHQFLYREI
jgi:hypothetical protein